MSWPKLESQQNKKEAKIQDVCVFCCFPPIVVRDLGEFGSKNNSSPQHLYVLSRMCYPHARGTLKPKPIHSEGDFSSSNLILSDFYPFDVAWPDPINWPDGQAWHEIGTSSSRAVKNVFVFASRCTNICVPMNSGQIWMCEVWRQQVVENGMCESAMDVVKNPANPDQQPLPLSVRFLAEPPCHVV